MPLGFGLAQLLDSTCPLDRNRHQRADGLQRLPGKLRSGNTEAADGADTQTDGNEVVTVLCIRGNLIEREGLLHLSLIEMSRAESGAIKFVLLWKKQRSRAGLKTFDDIIRDGVHQLDDIPFAQQLAAELVQALNLMSALVCLVRFRANARGKPAAGNRGDQKRYQRDPILRISDGQGPYRRQEEIVESRYRDERHGNRNGHSPHGRNC